MQHSISLPNYTHQGYPPTGFTYSASSSTGMPPGLSIRTIRKPNPDDLGTIYNWPDLGGSWDPHAVGRASALRPLYWNFKLIARNKKSGETFSIDCKLSFTGSSPGDTGDRTPGVEYGRDGGVWGEECPIVSYYNTTFRSRFFPGYMPATINPTWQQTWFTTGWDTLVKNMHLEKRWRPDVAEGELFVFGSTDGEGEQSPLRRIGSWPVVQLSRSKEGRRRIRETRTCPRFTFCVSRHCVA